MSEEAYEKLADALDRLPNGFARTPSGVEMPLLKKMYRPDEAWLASQLRREAEAPDVIATGELHKVDVSMYNNIRIIASSCWQSQTPFEEKVGNMTDPCKVPILNLRNNSVKIIDFS